MTPPVDWLRWLDPCEDPKSDLIRRVLPIRTALTEWLDDTAPRPVRLLSVCSGDGRDIIGALTRRPDAARVAALLLESDPRTVERARRHAEAKHLDTVHLRHCDPAFFSEWRNAAPYDLVLLTGVLGNISDEDAETTIAALSRVCTPGSLVIWTRHRTTPDRTRPVRDWLNEAGFQERSFTTPKDTIFSVGVHQYLNPRTPQIDLPERLFTFAT